MVKKDAQLRINGNELLLWNYGGSSWTNRTGSSQNDGCTEVADRWQSAWKERNIKVTAGQKKKKTLAQFPRQECGIPERQTERIWST